MIQQLTAPTEDSKSISHDSLSWTAVTGATGYHIYVNGTRRTTYPIVDTHFDLRNLNLPAGNHNIQIRAVGTGNHTDSVLSQSITFQVEGRGGHGSWFADNIIYIGIGVGAIVLLGGIVATSIIVVKRRKSN